MLDTLKPIQDSSAEAEALAAVAAAFTDPEHFGEKETLQMQLEKLEREADRAEKDGKSKEALKFRRCTFQGYLLLDTRDGAKEAIRLGEKCLENERLEEQEIKRIRAGMAASRESLKNTKRRRTCMHSFWKLPGRMRKDWSILEKRRHFMKNVEGEIWRLKSASGRWRNSRRNGY